ncbi:unnamed protein product [Sympodiomycopsis kandeliae]
MASNSSNHTQEAIAQQPHLADASDTASSYSAHKDAEAGKGDIPVITNDNRSEDTLLPQGRQLGLVSTVFLIVNRIIGTGVFATTSTILAQSGSVGMSLLYWVIGAVIAACGFAVYAEFASTVPKNGGELNYLQLAYRKPKFLVTVMYAAQALLLGQAAGNSYTSGAYFMRAAGVDNFGEWQARGIGAGVLISAVILHGGFLKWGLRVQNLLGSFKVAVLLVIAFAGFAALAGHTKVPVENNFANAFAGSRNDIYGIASCIYNAVWSYVGYSNAMYSIGEVKNPVRTLKIAGPLAIGVIAVVYLLVQIAYFAAVNRADILGSEQIIADLFFRNVFGEKSAKALSTFVALSAVANVYSVVFSQGRLNQALGRDDVVPFGKILASNRPFNTPLAGISWHVIVTLVILLAPPAGDVYNIVLNISSYPLNVVNSAVGLALVTAYLPRKMRPSWAQEWNPPFKATLPIALLFTLISMFLVVVPWIAPERPEESVYDHTWYAIAPAISLGIFAGGAVYWLIRFFLLPKIGGYTLVPRTAALSDGTVVTEFKRE